MASPRSSLGIKLHVHAFRRGRRDPKTQALMEAKRRVAFQDAQAQRHAPLPSLQGERPDERRANALVLVLRKDEQLAELDEIRMPLYRDRTDILAAALNDRVILRRYGLGNILPVELLAEGAPDLLDV